MLGAGGDGVVGLPCGRGCAKDFHFFLPAFAHEVLDRSAYKAAADGLHRAGMGDWAGLGDVVYTPWQLGLADVVKGNYHARFAGEVLADFTHISEIHRVSAMMEVPKQRTKYKHILHNFQMANDGMLELIYEITCCVCWCGLGKGRAHRSLPIGV